jgi:hypothetical protein
MEQSVNSDLENDDVHHAVLAFSHEHFDMLDLWASLARPHAFPIGHEDRNRHVEDFDAEKSRLREVICEGDQRLPIHKNDRSRQPVKIFESLCAHVTSRYDMPRMYKSVLN